MKLKKSFINANNGNRNYLQYRYIQIYSLPSPIITHKLDGGHYQLELLLSNTLILTELFLKGYTSGSGQYR